MTKKSLLKDKKGAVNLDKGILERTDEEKIAYELEKDISQETIEIQNQLKNSDRFNKYFNEWIRGKEIDGKKISDKSAKTILRYYEYNTGKESPTNIEY